METKAITTLFTERGTIVCPASTLNGKLQGIESLFEGCDSKLAGAEMSGCGYDSQRDAINTMTENMRQLSLYAASAHNRVSENLDKPLYEHFKKNATETITAIKLSEITTDNTFGLSEYVEIKRQGQYFRHKNVKDTLTMEDFLGIQEITAEDGTPILENAETVWEFASLFRKDYDTMLVKDMSLEEYLEWYSASGDASHKGYHPVSDMISGIVDIIIFKPMIECITGKDLITGEHLTETEVEWKQAGMLIDLITLGMGSKALAGAKTFKEVLKISGKTLTVDALSAAAAYGTAYIGEELGLSEESIFILSMLAGGSVSYAGGKVLLKNADEVVKRGTKTFRNVSELSNEQIEALIKYTGDDYVNINNSLRGLDTLSPENQTTVEAMKSALDNSALPQDMTLYRGTSTEVLGSLQNLSVDELIGKTFTEQGFMSTSTSNVIAESFSGNMKMTIEASKGAQALDISSISQYTTEAEVLFNAGQEMLITSAEVSDGILNITVIIE